MPALVPLVVAIPFLFTGWVIHRVLGHRAHMRRLEDARTQPSRALAPAEREVLEQRIANLEAIVCSEDFGFDRVLADRGAA